MFIRKRVSKVPRPLKILRNLNPEMPGLQLLKLLTFTRALQKLQNWVSISIFFLFEILFCLHY